MLPASVAVVVVMALAELVVTDAVVLTPLHGDGYVDGTADTTSVNRNITIIRGHGCGRKLNEYGLCI